MPVRLIRMPVGLLHLSLASIAQQRVVPEEMGGGVAAEILGRGIEPRGGGKGVCHRHAAAGGAAGRTGAPYSLSPAGPAIAGIDLRPGIGQSQGLDNVLLTYAL